jgi:hypothetical protein
MISSKIENIIVKYINKSATSSDLDVLTDWIKTPENEQLFKDYVRIHYAVIFNLNDLDANQIKDRLIHKIRKNKTIFNRSILQSTLKYVAIALLFLTIGFLYQQDVFNLKSSSLIIPKEEFVTLELENGKIEVINILSSKEIKDTQGNLIGKQNKTKLSYSAEANTETLVYNKLNVPYGKQFELILSDGTKIQLNAGTSIKYPIKFIKGHNRQVHLNGEAYFEVVSDAQHPFIVNAEELKVEVLGTKFNVSAYIEDNTTNVVLIEGSVNLSLQGDAKENAVLLSPGIKGSLIRSINKITTEKVNTSLYTGWMQGGLIFRNASFKNIVKKLERHYNVEIIINNEELKDEIFNANFNKLTIDKVLSYFNDSYDIDYTIKENTIYIN